MIAKRNYRVAVTVRISEAVFSRLYPKRGKKLRREGR